MNPDTLEKIYKTLEEIRSLLLLINQDKLREVRKSLVKPGTVKEEIYDMCDETKTIDDMAQSLGKGRGYVRSYLSILRREGLIRNVSKEGKQVYQQVF